MTPSFDTNTNVIAQPRSGRVRGAPRDSAIDVLRGLVTALVVVHHVALMYGAIGAWYWREQATSKSLTSLLLTFFDTLNQAWFMGFFFLLAGSFVPDALVRKRGWRFITDRAVRLGIPLLVYGWVLGPMTIALARTDRGMPFLATWGSLIRHNVFEAGPLWFAAALLVMTVAVVPFRRWMIQPRPFPSEYWLAGAAGIAAAGALIVRQYWPVGESWWIGWQLGYFPAYLVLFALGCLGGHAHWWQQIPPESTRLWRRITRWSLPVLPIVALLGPSVPVLSASPDGGWSVPSVVYALWEPLVAWGIILRLLTWAQVRFNDPGVLLTKLGQRAFTIFVIHPPIVVAVGLTLKGLPAPALLKFGLSGFVSVLISFWMAGLLLAAADRLRRWAGRPAPL